MWVRFRVRGGVRIRVRSGVRVRWIKVRGLGSGLGVALELGG